MCKDGGHDLIQIWSSYQVADTYAVVRWCKFCGAVVVDSQYDDEIITGGVMKMKFPEILFNKGAK